jgi:hypothetical protein
MPDLRSTALGFFANPCPVSRKKSARGYPVIHGTSYNLCCLLSRESEPPPPLPPPSVPPFPSSAHPSSRSAPWPSRWIRHTSLPSGSRPSFTVRVFRGLFGASLSHWCPGINFTLCWICGYVLIKKKNKTPWIMVAVVVFQWTLSTVHVSLGFTVRRRFLHLPPRATSPPSAAIDLRIHIPP